MTRVILLEQLKKFTEQTTADLIMPVCIQKGDNTKEGRPADVYLMRLPDSRSAMKKAPYILHQFITGMDAQSKGEKTESSAKVRSIFCVYCEDEQDGGLMLLNLMERLRIGLLKKVVIGNQFVLDKEAGVEAIAYPDDTAPYFCGEIISTWMMPVIEREVNL